MNNNNLQALFLEMNKLISTNTVVGEAVHYGDVILVPLVEVSFGAGGGSGQYPANSGGEGGGIGARLIPTAVVVIVNGTVQLVNVKQQESVNKMIDLIPGLLSKFDFNSLFGKKDKKEDKKEDKKDDKTEAASEE